MIDTDSSLLEVRSKHVLRIIRDKPEKLGKRNILFEPGVYDGNGKALVRPFRSVNLAGHPSPNKPVVFKNFKIHDALFVNCCLRDNIKKGPSNGKPSLRHHLRIFNAVLVENLLSNCSTMDFEDFLMLESEKRGKPSKIVSKSIVEFLRAYLSTIRKFETLLPSHRKGVLPEYVQSRFKIFVTICNDGIAVWFRRAIVKRKDTIKMSTRSSLRNVIPKLSADKNFLPLDGQTNILIKDLAIVTEGFFDSMYARGYKMEGTVLKISDTFGILEVKSGADIKLENVLFGFLDKYGKPKQILLKVLWVIASDVPSLFSVAEGKERAQMEFFDRLVTSGPIKGEKMKRYSEADMAREIEDVKRDYISLVFRENAEEPELQQFLEKHPFILSPTYLDVCSGSLDVTPQVRLSRGKRIVDFLLLFEPDFEKARRLATVIEIKRPSHNLFVKKCKNSKPLRVGLQQVEEVFRIIKENPQEANKLGLRHSDDISGMVLIGRRSDLNEEEISYLEQINEPRTLIKIDTFDALIENIETVKGFYGVKGRKPVVVVGQEGTSDEDFTGKTGETIQSAIDYLGKRIAHGR